MNILLFILLFPLVSLASFPENSLRIPLGVKSNGGLDEIQFHNVIDKVMKIYSPKVEAMGGTLNISRLWTSDKVNASTNRFAHVYQVTMFGGMARHPLMNMDGFTLVLCHELGHHLGGAPKVKNSDQRWASNEGQADYFAALKCLREVFIREDNQKALSKISVPKIVKDSCERIYKSQQENLVCQRINMAGLTVGKLYASLVDQNGPSFETPQNRIVRETIDYHPHYQCRLDTFFQGSLCDRPLNEELSNRDAHVGTCHPMNGDNIGIRPACWFKF